VDNRSPSTGEGNSENVEEPFLRYNRQFKQASRHGVDQDNIVDRIQAQLGAIRKDSIGISEILLELIKSSLESGDNVLVTGFGKFPNPRHER